VENTLAYYAALIIAVAKTDPCSET